MTSVYSSQTPQASSTHLNAQGASVDAPSLLAIPTADFDPTISLDFIQPTPVKERMTEVQRLAQENERLARELKELNDRLAAAERKTAELAQKKGGKA